MAKVRIREKDTGEIREIEDTDLGQFGLDANSPINTQPFVPTNRSRLDQVQKLLPGITAKTQDDLTTAGFEDSDAARLFLTKTKAFRDLWIGNMLDEGGVPEGGFGIDDVKTNWE